MAKDGTPTVEALNNRPIAKSCSVPLVIDGRQGALDASRLEGFLVIDPSSLSFSLSKSGMALLSERKWQRPLRQIFDFYRKINTLMKAMQAQKTSSALLFSDIERVNEVISLGEYIKFLHDFRVVPNKFSRQFAQDLFVAAHRSAADADASASASASEPASRSSSRPSSASKMNSGNGSNPPRESEVKRDGGFTQGANWVTFLGVIARCAVAADLEAKIFRGWCQTARVFRIS